MFSMGGGVEVGTSEIFDNTCDWKGMGRKQEKLIVGKPVEQFMRFSVEFSTIVTLVGLYCSVFCILKLSFSRQSAGAFDKRNN
jgi:hypothetical protein